MKSLCIIVPLALSMLGGLALAEETVKLSSHDREALQLGRKVLAVKAAIRNPEAPESMAAILDLGRDSRYFVMVRGWLAMQLEGDLSIVDTGAASFAIVERVEFLENAIRALDLE
jgi:hypothetical protein